MIYALLFPLLCSAIFPPETMPVIEETSERAQTEKSVTKDEPDTVACNCVKFVRTKRADAPFINAKDFRIATSTPFIGAIAKMYYPHSNTYHVAYVVDFGDDWVEILDANYKSCQITHRRVYMPDRIIGYL